MENIAHIEALTALAVGIIFGLVPSARQSASASSAAASWKAWRASPNCTGIARQNVRGRRPSGRGRLHRIGFALFFTFANPFVSAFQAAAAAAH